MQFARVQYRSQPSEPEVGDGLHVIARCHLLQAEAQVAEQKAKRRGGPKKVWLQYALLDAAGRVTSRQLLIWKTISTKNFSNRANIEQYERNPYGWQHADMGAGAAPSAPQFALVLSGVGTGKGPSNTVGVNVRGKDVAQHPRFVLSTGKTEAGARTLLTFYHSDPTARVQLQALWIEHRELRVSFESVDENGQASDSATPLLEFASKPAFKTMYSVRPASEDDAAIAMAEAQHQFPAPIEAPAVKPVSYTHLTLPTT